MFKKSLLTLAFTGFATLSAYATAADALTLEVYNPGEKSVFPVSSEIISGKHEVALIDAQFQRNDAEELVKKIRATGKKLTTVYISHSDPDFYFGLDVIKAAFPDAKIIASPGTIKDINATKDGKVAYWGPILKNNAPTAVVVPQPLQGDSFSIDGQKVEVKGLTGPTPDRTFVWIPSLKAVVGGVAVAGDNIHPWVADNQTAESRLHWQQTLASIQALKPQVVVPGHFLPGAAQTLESVSFTQQYLTALEGELPKAKDSAALIAAMKKHYPNLKDESSLELSAKVLKGEMKWPQ
ncbi:MBL fold metallo-hydrolase [Serratia ficaria]|uniref:Arsenate reductase and related proteins, glutaredoxin family n=1 Tax=Serratia ficaria TaxID=61651 RepID=A0A240C9S8_SERFI|nr:MBL fold metallo-hydrolase [Serratia ficaria]MEE4484864.1 MBL fold metallo-hydrolase [Serratia ficaria]REF43305.1 glyoxylase-like metal-dependent hydrolase (beta-lactamase superfamily II) [Serratia ficaria]CAI0699632.1 Arsenate reductase and related proteins, glutaredoxin family [Serratia ficaria]CAI1064430.1 Arsenate reductase and related proteins, glutaredoxin family [Serratia ficaria]CAI1083015.1 Arsenate reductase and related proteins, glutaredoxin family [Serratia ficaria]